MTYGAEIWGPPLANAAATAASSALSSAGKGDEESKIQRKKRKLIDQLLASLTGEGAYSDLFKADENAFQRSFVEPAQSSFRNQIAPQIQQQYIASGQQRGTGLDDTLTRAGVDLNSLLNQQFYQFQQDALNRKQGSINSILGAGSGPAPGSSTGQDIMSGLSGYLQSEGFGQNINDMFKPKPTLEPQRKGFEPDVQ
jgi:hypothetical protein